MGTAKTWSTWPWVYTAVCSGASVHDRICSCTAPAWRIPPASIIVSIPSDTNAVTLAKLSRNASPSPSSFSVVLPVIDTGCRSSMAAAPERIRSERARRSVGGSATAEP
jgi:hypothetical protein